MPVPSAMTSKSRGVHDMLQEALALKDSVPGLYRVVPDESRADLGIMAAKVGLTPTGHEGDEQGTKEQVVEASRIDDIGAQTSGEEEEKSEVEFKVPRKLVVDFLLDQL